VLFSSAELRTGLDYLEGYVCVAQELTELKRIEGELVAPIPAVWALPRCCGATARRR
jgi:hypothetical protein